MNTHALLIDYIWQKEQTNKIQPSVRFFGSTLLASLFIALSAQFSVPLYLVPITGQTFAVFLCGFVLGKNKGIFAVVLYLTEGLAGFPVFANGGFGIHTLLGASGGYLLGFLPAVYICGYFAEKHWDREYLKLAVVFIFANFTLYACGLLQLGLIIEWDKQLLELGFYPFIFGDAVKMSIVTLMLPTFWKFINTQK